ncbi:Aspartyl protease APCB1 [Glycine soja]
MNNIYMYLIQPICLSQKKRLASSFKLHYAAKEVTMAFGEGETYKKVSFVQSRSYLIFWVQDQVPPFPSETPIAIVEEEFGSPLASVFDHFEYEPIAAAASPKGCDSFSYLRRVSDRLLDENFGRQRYCTVNRAIGNPPKVYELDIYTGSYLTWTQCDASCKGCTLPCNRQYKPHGNLVKCVDPLCGAIQSALSLPHVTTNVQCDYQVQYADQGSSLGVLVYDIIPLKLTNINLACFMLAFR